MSNKPHENWSSKIGFVLASLGSALGLGAMWKLPYVIGQNGGGAFLLLFIAFNFLIGFPLFVGEVSLGRRSQRGVVSSFSTFSNAKKGWGIVGWLTVLVVFLILGWYCVVSGWALAYIVIAITDSFRGLSAKEIATSFDYLREDFGLNLLFQAIFIALNAAILNQGLNRGIERYSKFMTTTLFIVLIGLCAFAIQLSGFEQGLFYIIYPDFSKLSAEGVVQALALALFTLSVGYGANITYGAYLKSDADILKNGGSCGVR